MVECYQLEPGPIRIEYEHRVVGNVIVSQFSTSRKLLFNGPGVMNGYITPSFYNSKIENMMVGGVKVDQFDIAEFRIGSQEFLYTIEAGVTQYAFNVPVEEFERIALTHIDAGELPKIYDGAAKPLTPHYHRELMNTWTALWNTDSEDLDGLIQYRLNMLLCECVEDPKLKVAKPNKHIGSIVDTVLKLPPGTPISAETVVKAVKPGRATVFRACRETLGVGPLELQRALNMCRARKLWKDGKLNTKIELAAHIGYGANSVQEMTSWYRSHFGIHPDNDRVS